MILLWGVPGDRPLMAARNAISRLGYEATFLNQWDILDTQVELEVGISIRGEVRLRRQSIDLAKIEAAYLRPYCSADLPIVQQAAQKDRVRLHAERVDEVLCSWADLTPALVVNRPRAMASNNSKPYQSTFAQALGFAVPDTLITTDPDAARQFWEGHGTVIYKSMSAIRSVVSRLIPERAGDLEAVMWCPTQFQEYIPGVDYRVHVVGERVFACTITSLADDYRYAASQGYTTEIRACDLPQEIAERCRVLTERLRLRVSGIDLRLRPDGRWYCFEVNPSPAFTYYQDATGQNIDEALAHLLGNSSSYELTTRLKSVEFEPQRPSECELHM